MVSTLNQHSSSNQPQFWIGRFVGDANRYRLDQRLGGGGMGEVFVATDTRLGKPVALKLLKESLAISEHIDLRERFEQECSICAALKSPHIVQVTDYGVTSEGYPFYVMEYLQGQTLGELIEAQRQLSVARTCNIITQVCDGLRSAHSGVAIRSAEGVTNQIKVVHRDLKPANILLIPSALGELAKVIDFGIAKIRSLQTEYDSATNLFLGTCHYASPEQFNMAADVDERADIYSLGVILYEMLTGVDPFGFNFRSHAISNEKWLGAHLRKAPIPLGQQPGCAHIPAGLETIVLRCLEKQPANRFSSVTELSEALQAVSVGAPIVLPPVDQAEVTRIRSGNAAQPQGGQVVSASPAPSSHSGLRKWLLIGGGMLVALTLTVGTARLLQPSKLTAPAISQNVEQNQFSLNTHRLTLVKTLTENLATAKPVWSAILSPDSQTLFSAGEDRDPFDARFLPIKVWDLDTGEAPNTLNDGHTAAIYSLSLSQDGRILASGSADSTIKIWDVTTEKLLQTLRGHTGTVWSVALSRDGKTLVSGGEDKTIKIWDLQTGTVKHTLTEHTGVVYSVALSPDGKTIVSGSQDRTIKIWQTESGELLRTLSQPQGHRDTVRAVAISPDGKKIASGSWEKNVKLWDLQTGKLLRTYEGHTDKVTTVTFINDQTLASGSLDKTIRIWDTESEKSQEIQDAHTNWVLSVMGAANQMLVSASSDKTIKLWQWTKLSDSPDPVNQ